MKRSSAVPRIVTLALALVLAALPLRAQITVEGGHIYPATVEVADRTLQLSGAGYRGVRIYRGYAAALYLQRKASTSAEALAQDGPKRIQMVMLIDVPAIEFAKAFDKYVARNTPAAEMPALRERMARFDALIEALGTVQKNDVVDLDYVPERGLVFKVNGKLQGEPIPGADLYGGLMRIFIGDRPVDKEMKIGMLGGPVG